MKYDLHQRPILNDNAMPDRCFYIPYLNRPCDLYDFSLSEELTLLSDWRFSYFEKFSESIINECAKDKIKVPSMWQLSGYDRNAYINYRYPFPVTPPEILCDIPCGLYVTNYRIKEKVGKYYINFEGVDSAYYLFVNGNYSGYATTPHSKTEFDITDKLQRGNNEIKVIVLKWCSGSYFECQDKLRMSGIFREVYILNRPEGHLFDYKVTTDGASVIDFCGDKECDIRLYYGDKPLAQKHGSNVSFNVVNPKLWTAETPYLYTLEIERLGEKIYEKVGLRKITTDGGVLKLNGKPIKLKGVNRHSSTVNGYVETVADMVKDLKLMKKYNVNAIRTSHYPPHPYFTELCDEYGVYVMEEADIETHGLVAETGEYRFEGWARLACDKTYEEVIVGRCLKMYRRDKNRSSVIAWSLGNESGFSFVDGEPCNFTSACKALKSFDDRPLHYESNYLPKPDKNFRHVKENVLDFYSRMYPGLQDMAGYVTGEKDYLDNRPFVLCEYTHAMGNSCGDAKAYWDLIYSNDKFCGGFVWEWINHGVYDKEGRFLYGGDFGEVLHDKNFCADGLVELDRSAVHTSLLEVSEAYSPFDISFDADGFYCINRRDFLTLDDLDCKLIIKKNGEILLQKEVDVKGITPREKKLLDLPIVKEEGYITYDFILTDSVYGIKNVRQIVATDRFPVSKFEIKKKDFSSNKIAFGDYRLSFSENGLIDRIEKDGVDLLKEPMRFNIWRAPLDNDMYLRAEWERFHFDKAYFVARSVEKCGSGIKVVGHIVYDSFLPFADVALNYLFDDDKIKITVSADLADYIPAPARFGLRFAFDRSFDSVRYFARGDKENYEDKYAYAPVGLYGASVSDMTEIYSVPQENGAHGGARWLQISSDKASVAFERDKDFSFNVSEFDDRSYPKHSYDLTPDGKTFVCVDYRMSGVGSNACGPALDEKYSIKEKHIEWDITLIFK